MLLLACVGAAETMPANGPCRKSLNLLQISLPACEKSFLNILFVDCPNKSALNAISSRSKTETLFALCVLRNRKLLLFTVFKTPNLTLSRFISVEQQ